MGGWFLIAFLMGSLVLVVFPASATTFTVTDFADTAEGSCDAHCSLREAEASVLLAAGLRLDG